jgi:hypothetical protein
MPTYTFTLATGITEEDGRLRCHIPTICEHLGYPTTRYIRQFATELTEHLLSALFDASHVVTLRTDTETPAVVECYNGDEEVINA